MNVKTMEGLAGASASIRMISTPMSAANEAERKGDTDKMQRALGYAAGLKEQAEDYREKANQGMKIEAKEETEKEKKLQEELAETRIREGEEQKKRLEEGRQKNAARDTVEISEAGKSQAGTRAGTEADTDGPDSSAFMNQVRDVTYDSSGEALEAAGEAGFYVDVKL